MKVMIPKLIGLAMVGGLAFNGLNDVEGYLAPIVEISNFTPYHREVGVLCEIHRFTRLRDGKAKFIAWDVQDAADPDNHAPLLPYDPSLNRMVRVNENSPVGVSIDRNRCFELPGPLRGMDRALVFTARSDFDPWHHLWLVPQTLGPFRVEANQP